MRISRNYFLESGDTSESTVILHVNEHEDICFLIKELVNEGDKYIVGNITFDEAPKFGCNEKLKNKYNGYFYINYFDDNDARFNLTRDEIKSKFNKKLKYKKAKKFLNEYGDGVIDLTEEIIFFNFFFSFFLTFCVWIIILILKKLYSISKIWLYQETSIRKEKNDRKHWKVRSHFSAEDFYNLPIKVRQRVEKTLEDGKISGVFYDKTRNKIFVWRWLGLGSFLGDFADRYTPGELQYGTSEEVNRRQKTENLAVKLPTDILVSRAVNGFVLKQFKMNKAGNSNKSTVIEPSEKDYTLNSSKSNWNFKSEIPKTAVKNSEGNYELGRGNEWSVGNEFENVSQNNNTSNYINRIINKDGTSNIPKGTGYTTIDNRPYIENRKPKGRPSFRKDFPQKLYNQYNGAVQALNTKEIINWKPGEPKKGIVDFGHKPDRKYSDIFYQEYLPEKWTPQQLRDWYNDPQNYQFEVPINNQGHKFE